ncbi:hypothetical protein SANTM175S_05514 [Streptomyces antimycoticus]
MHPERYSRSGTELAAFSRKVSSATWRTAEAILEVCSFASTYYAEQPTTLRECVPRSA